MAKVMVLGGAGAFGRGVSRLFAASDAVAELVLGGRRVEPMAKLASELGPKVAVVQVEATDEERLASVLSDFDLVANLAGPEFVVQLPVLRAAIRAGAHYCDIAGDSPTTERALELATEAEKAGVTAITGIGVVPGVSNLMMMHAAAQFDQANSLAFCSYFPVVTASWLDPKRVHEEIAATGRVDAALQIITKWVSRPARSYEDGRWVDLDPRVNKWEMTLPQGGVVRAHPSCSTEPITIPRYVPGIRTVRSLICLYPPQFDQLYLEAGELLASGKADAAGATRRFYEEAVKDSGEWPATSVSYSRNIEGWVTATGRKGDKVGRYYGAVLGEWLSTQAMIAAAGLRILRGQIPEKGVFPPEACFDPMPFLIEASELVGKRPKDDKFLDERFTWA
jgi:hypothetical protein